MYYKEKLNCDSLTMTIKWVKNLLSVVFATFLLASSHGPFFWCHQMSSEQNEIKVVNFKMIHVFTISVQCQVCSIHCHGHFSNILFTKMFFFTKHFI